MTAPPPRPGDEMDPAIGFLLVPCLVAMVVLAVEIAYRVWK